jgi:hypothetical protein
MSTEETIPRPTVGFVSLYTDLPADGREEGGGTPPARLNDTPICQPASPGKCPPGSRAGAGPQHPGRGTPGGPVNLPPAPSIVRTTKDPMPRVVTEAETGLCVQLGWQSRPSRSRSKTWLAGAST